MRSFLMGSGWQRPLKQMMFHLGPKERFARYEGRGLLQGNSPVSQTEEVTWTEVSLPGEGRKGRGIAGTRKSRRAEATWGCQGGNRTMMGLVDHFQ